MLAAALSATFLLTACTSDTATAPTPTATATPTIAQVDTSSVRTLIESDRETPTVETTGTVPSIAGETAIGVSYPSGGLNVTGVLRMPQAEQPVPIVIVVHGSVDPERYETGRDLVPEQRALLDAGYAVLAVDMRGYAGSDAADAASPSVDPGFGWATVLDWGMALDVVGALEIARSGQLEGVEPDAVGLLGHSLGGLLALDAAVIAPGAADLVIAMSAPAADLDAAIELAVAADPDVAELLPDGVPSPTENPEYWADISPASFFDRATEPLLLIHGSADDVAPAQWAQDTADAWTQAGGDAEVVILEGGDHHLEPRRDEGDAIIVAAFDAVLR